MDDMVTWENPRVSKNLLKLMKELSKAASYQTNAKINKF
jgi:hypothetical protein